MKMKYTKLLLTLILVSIYTFKSNAQNGQDIIDQFFTNFETKGASIAVDELYKTNPWTTRIQDAINNVKTQLERYDENLVGKYYGYEHIVTKKLANSYVLHSYFVKFDRQPIRFTFQFYKPAEEWRLYSFQFDDNYDDEIEEAAKMYYLDLDN